MLIRTDCASRRWLWMNMFIAAATLAVFVWQQIDPTLMPRHQLMERSRQVWPFVTYAFLHLGLAHLLPNLLILVVLGGCVNDRLGAVGYLAFYLGGAVISGLGFLLLGGEAVVGNSGAVGAVMTAYLVLFPRSRLHIDLRLGHLEVSAPKVVVAFFLVNLLLALLPFSGGQFVASEAHIAGMVYGFVMTWALLMSGLLSREPGDLLALLSHWNRRRVYRRLVRKEGFDPFALARAGEAQQPGRVHERSAEPDPLVMHAAMLRAQASEAVAQQDYPLAAALYRKLRSVDPNQVLPRQAQLDVAAQLASEQRHGDAAEAYEQFLRTYPTFDQIEQVQLMLGLIYARYLDKYARAKECLIQSLEKLHDPKQVELAQTELRRIEPMLYAPRRPT